MAEHDQARAGEPAAPAPATSVASRRPYQRPVLTEYGSLGKLTQSGGMTQFEGASGRMMMM